MKSNVINNYRMGGYLLVAIGLINLRYQSGHGSVLQHSLAIIIPGGLILASTWIPATIKKLESKAFQAMSIVLGLVLIAYAVIN
jgi:Cu/Ag efflux pump CusA